jgi:ribosome-binding factor A
LSHLKKASSYLQNYCKQAEGWFRAPNFKFVFDHSLDHQNKMDDLFEKINKELNKDG